jgi:hypothetical protein
MRGIDGWARALLVRWTGPQAGRRGRRAVARERSTKETRKMAEFDNFTAN